MESLASPHHGGEHHQPRLVPAFSRRRRHDRVHHLGAGRGLDGSARPCHHGVLRWGAECPCAAHSAWKQPLRAAFDRLAAAIDVRTELAAADLGIDPWAARDRY
ncbi:MAG: DUF3536 domain-containing protein, partial [Gemmatimonadetes bacterium]|nr:DUF3536 domain-containing protein [Gemmatimonadota bacterium]